MLERSLWAPDNSERRKSVDDWEFLIFDEGFLVLNHSKVFYHASKQVYRGKTQDFLKFHL